MRATFLTRADDVGVDPYDSIAWAFEVHIKEPDEKRFQCAILYGNEDAPKKIELWESANPNYDAPPDRVWEPEA